MNLLLQDYIGKTGTLLILLVNHLYHFQNQTLTRAYSVI
jgi:hypothetical protein